MVLSCLILPMRQQRDPNRTSMEEQGFELKRYENRHSRWCGRRRWDRQGWMVMPCGVMGLGVISTVSWLHDREQVRTSLNIGFVIYKREIIYAS